MNFAARSKGSKPIPPLKGSFPLDHVGDCKALMAEYMDCLRQNQMNTTPCRRLARDYFACRVDFGLMDPTDFFDAGFDEKDLLDARSLRASASQAAEENSPSPQTG
eukprot:CAMPEP_0177669280 /NCGR_PEP_ID=MMETSP0447-20121125/23337_1 /TAXON_ID=0 /ORGANISM="Stygamoeba regulata, Strain BSH-02190019" /LENGTH=105 /DNA_ID=CAMNT_0019176097 /DNA_START=57 /DNA_END=370 /DNA_ORIENTATION=+